MQRWVRMKPWAATMLRQRGNGEAADEGHRALYGIEADKGGPCTLRGAQSVPTWRVLDWAHQRQAADGIRAQAHADGQALRA